ncbi:hypothetical protein FCL47_12210 [Desulfopila sp. IMCC35006]|uniref:hypothetical protein n=1 Tax=Desulfopila sp. IMCC35006 TaxID=2569542 RepID=UPI0010AC94E3|nr:hypothetical protein [Desulfopila sp. IMCC35006]TKB25853.1 hypothetical protein FCL47_12210 [Desulfopila sp. IMCC35006]
MKSQMTYIGVLMVFAAIAVVFFGGFLAIGYVWHLYVELDATLRLILLSSFAVFLVGCFVLAGAIKSSAQLKNKGRMVGAKINLYKTLVDLYGSYLSVSQAATAQSQKKTLGRISELNAEMTILADSSVIEAHRKLVEAISNNEAVEKLTVLYQQLIRKMRQDMGHSISIEESKLRFHKTGEHFLSKTFPQDEKNSSQADAQSARS